MADTPKNTLVESVYQSMDTLFSNNYTLGNIKYVAEDIDNADTAEKEESNNGGKNFVSLMAEYEENEEINNHSENLLLLAKAVGNEEDIELAEKMLKRRDELGHFDNAFYDDRNALQDKLWPLFVAAYEEEKGNAEEVNESNDSDDDKLWYTSSSGKLEFQMTLDQAQSVSQPGKDAEEDVRELMRDADMKEVVDYLFDNMDAVKEDLKETGAWDEEDLEDEDMNIVRMIWIAGNQISEDATMNSENDEMKENIDEEDNMNESVDGEIISGGKFNGFKLVAQSALGIKSLLVNVYGISGRIIGFINKDDIQLFKNGNVEVFRPIEGWKNEFSNDLKKKLGLI